MGFRSSISYRSRRAELLEISSHVRTSENMYRNAVTEYLKLNARYSLHQLTLDQLVVALNNLRVTNFVDLEFAPLSASLMTKTNAKAAYVETRWLSSFEALVWKRCFDLARKPSVQFFSFFSFYVTLLFNFASYLGIALRWGTLRKDVWEIVGSGLRFRRFVNIPK